MSEKHEMPADPPDKAGNNVPGYETTDVSGRFVPVFAAAVIIGALILMPGLWWMLTAMLARSAARQPAVSPLVAREQDRLPRQPLLEGIESPNLARNRQAANDAILHSYGWVDEKEQIVRIPIDQAMDIAVGKLHSDSTKDSKSSTEAEMPRSSNSGRMLKEVSP